VGDGGLFGFTVHGPEPVDLVYDGADFGPVDGPPPCARALYAEALGARPGSDDRVRLAAHRVACDRLLTVRVLDPSGAPAVGVHVTWSPVRPDQPGRARTGPDGRVVISRLGPTRLSVHTTVPDERSEVWYAAIPRDHVLPAGQEIELRLRSPRMVEVAVRDAYGRPPQDVRVQTVVSADEVHYQRVGAHGRFCLRLAPDAPALLAFLVHARDDRGRGWLHRLGDVDVRGASVVLTLSDENLW
jgi:hypothetical protein